MDTERTTEMTVNRPTGSCRFCELDKKDLDQAITLASGVFSQDRFYRDLTGFTAEVFRAYWREFLPMVLADTKARLFGVKAGEELLALLVAAEPHFPSAINGLRFVWRMGRRAGPMRLLQYLSFVREWDRRLRRPPREQGRELRGLWILTDGGGRGTGLGYRLVRWAMEITRGQGKTLFTGFADAEKPGLAAFYRRLGFKVSDPFAFRGNMAVTLEFSLQPEGEGEIE